MAIFNSYVTNYQRVELTHLRSSTLAPPNAGLRSSVAPSRVAPLASGTALVRHGPDASGDEARIVPGWCPENTSGPEISYFYGFIMIYTLW